MNIEFGCGHRSKQLEKLILSKPKIFDGWYDQCNFGTEGEGRIYEVGLRLGYNVDGVHSLYGSISYILSEAKCIKKCDSFNCSLNECLEKREGK